MSSKRPPCPDEAAWLRYWDDELSPLEAEAAERHLAQCDACRSRMRTLAATLAAVDDHVVGDKPRPAPRALRSSTRRVPGWAYGVSAAAVAGLLLAVVPAGRSAVASVTSTYTVSHLETVAVTRSEMRTAWKELTQNGHVSLTRYGSVTAEGLRHAPTTLPLSELASQTGLPNMWPSALTAPATALVGTGGSVTLELHVNAVNALILDEGGTHLFPAALSGVPFTVNMPPRAVMMGAAGTNAAGVVVGEARVPTLTVPGGINQKQVWAAVTSLPFLPASVTNALAALPDPGSTALVPVTGSGQTVEFMGHHAVLTKAHGAWVLVYLHGSTLVGLAKQGSGGMSATQFVSWATSLYQ